MISSLLPRMLENWFMNVRFGCTSNRRVPKNAMLGPSTCASSITSPLLISLAALSTAAGF